MQALAVESAEEQQGQATPATPVKASTRDGVGDGAASAAAAEGVDCRSSASIVVAATYSALSAC